MRIPERQAAASELPAGEIAPSQELDGEVRALAGRDGRPSGEQDVAEHGQGQGQEQARDNEPDSRRRG